MRFPKKGTIAGEGRSVNGSKGIVFLAFLVFLAGLLLLLGPALFGSAEASEYPFGSKVLANDSDVGRPLFPLTVPLSIAYWDIGTFGYDEEDPVYLHIEPSACGAVNANDVRLTPLDNLTNLSAGSRVNWSDVDMNKPLKKLSCEIVYLNLYGSSAYDLDDPVYIHHYGQGSYEISGIVIEGFKERLPFSGKSIPVHGMSYARFSDGYRLFIFDKLISSKPEKVGQWRGLDIELLRGVYSDYYHVEGTWLVKVQSHIMAAGEDGLTLVDGIDGDVGDVVEYDGSGSAEGDIVARLLMTNDIRLTSQGGYDAGTKINNFDPDQNKLTASPALVSFIGPAGSVPEIGYFDGNGNGICDFPDDLYLNIPSGDSTGAVAVNYLRLSGPAS